MKIKTYFGLMLAVLALSSCSSQMYQVYEVQSPNLTIRDNSMVYENQDCKVFYNLWDKDGSMAFIFENTSDKDIFIDMSQSFFIKNGAAYDYFKNRSYDTHVYESIELGISALNTYINSYGYWPNRYISHLGNTVKSTVSSKSGTSTGVTIQEPKYVCVPAHAYKAISVYNIYPSFVTTCERSKDFPSNVATLETYNKDDSPLKFTNRIAYSFEEGGKIAERIDNNFWLSSVKNYSRKAAIERRSEKVGCTSAIKRKDYFKIGGPNQFYVSFNGSSEYPSW